LRRSGISREASLHAAERQTQGEFGWWVSAAGSRSLPTQSGKPKDEGYITLKNFLTFLLSYGTI